MALQTATIRNALATAYGSTATYAAITSTVPGASAGTEIARVAITWGTAVNGVITATATFNVSAGVTVVGASVHSASTAAYLDGGAVTSQAFGTAGTYTLTLTATVS